VLGAMHFTNLYVFTQLRRRAIQHKQPSPPPLPVPQGFNRATIG
jgi:hypothetical protein